MSTWILTRPIAALFMTAACSAVRAAEEHPRLMATPEIIAKVQKLAAVKGSHHEQALAAIRERVKLPLGAVDGDEGEAKTPPKAGPDVRACARRASELAFLSLFSTDQAERAKLAAEAATLLEAPIKSGGRGLQLATLSVNLGLAYDWAYPALPVVRGWVLTPAEAKVTAAKPVQVSVSGEKAEILVALWIGAGEPPAASVAGSGLESVPSIGQNKVRCDAKANKLVAA